MNPPNPHSDKLPPQEPPAAAGKPAGGSGSGRSSKEAALAERRLVERCLAGDDGAWERLYRKCHPRLGKAIELLLGHNADAHLVEEIAARVWYALVKDDCRLLAGYDADQDATLEGFLVGLARIEILRYARAERRRRSYEMLGGRRRLDESRVSDWQLASLLEEFSSTLTLGERQFMAKFLTGSAGDKGDQSLDDLSPTSVWARRHRIRRKLDRFLENL